MCLVKWSLVSNIVRGTSAVNPAHLAPGPLQPTRQERRTGARRRFHINADLRAAASTSYRRSNVLSW
jgi:hypothetical protein